MTPTQSTEINGHKVEEYYWSQEMVCYVDNRLSLESYSKTCERLRRGEEPKQSGPSQPAKEIAARIWCDKEMSNCVMDVEAATLIACIIDGVRRNQADTQSYTDLAVSGGIVDAP